MTERYRRRPGFQTVRAGEHAELLARLRQSEEALRALVTAVEELDHNYVAGEFTNPDLIAVHAALTQAHAALGDIPL